MQSTSTLSRAAVQGIRSALPAQGTALAREQATVRDFIGLLTGFRDSGGTAPGEIVTRLRAEYRREPLKGLASRIHARDVLWFDWHGCPWFPMFQFDVSDWSLKPGVSAVCKALPSDASNWEIAIWFTTVNARLGHHMPANMVRTNLPGVLDAAAHAGRSLLQPCMAA